MAKNTIVDVRKLLQPNAYFFEVEGRACIIHDNKLSVDVNDNTSWFVATITGDVTFEHVLDIIKSNKGLTK
jgi:hypothetical protein